MLPRCIMNPPAPAPGRTRGICPKSLQINGFRDVVIVRGGHGIAFAPAGIRRSGNGCRVVTSMNYPSSPSPNPMHARELVELAAILSAQGPMLIRSTPQLSSHGVQQYWTASKCRLDRWARNLKSFAADAAQLDATAVRMQWPLRPRRAGRDPHRRGAHPRVDRGALSLRSAARRQ